MTNSTPKLLTAILLVLGATGLAADAGDWVVLPERIHPRTAPSRQASTATLTLRYPQTIRETAPGGAESGWIAFSSGGRRYYLPKALAVPKTGRPPGEKGNLPLGRETVDRRTPLPLDYKPLDLVRLEQKWNYHGKDLPKLLRAEAARAAGRMLADAEAKHRIRLRVCSAYRSAASQRHLYLRKIGASGHGQQLVAKPGHSEHQLGTALDICGLDPKTVLKAAFAETPEGRWLKENAPKYGFRHSYTRKNAKETGYAPEPWHIRYVGLKSRKKD